MHPEDVALTRVYARECNTDVSDKSFSVANDFEIVIEAEAGKTLFDNEAVYNIDVTLYDKKDVSNIPVDPKDPAFTQTGHMRDTWWPNQVTQFVYTVSKNALAGKVGHSCLLSASLTVGAGTEPNVDAAEGPIIHHLPIRDISKILNIATATAIHF